MKIAALIPVKNEEWCLENCLKSLSFADVIISVDDNSTDNTLNILKKHKCIILNIDTDSNIGWKEYFIRKSLLEEARRQKATHIISIDADEACSAEFIENAREILTRLKKGQSLELEWLNLYSAQEYIPPRIFKEFAFYDDGISVYSEGFIGIPRVPKTNIEPLRSKVGKIFHYQFIDKERFKYKQAWYMISEFLKKDKGPRKINNLYKNYIDINEKKLIKTDEFIDIPKIKDCNIWQRQEILSWFDKYGIVFFEPLNIWQMNDLEKLFIAKTGRKPKPKKFPKILVILNDIKNKIKNI